MDVQLNAFEVLEIAERIERNGANFYRKAAELVDDDRVSKIFRELVNWEATHIAVFAKMKQRLSAQNWEQGTFEPDRIELPEAQVMAGLAVFGIRPDPSSELTGQESREEILRMAVEKEKDSVVYYTGLKDFVSSELEKGVIEDIIKEEIHHIRILMQSLE